jgi:hypothetical protein
VNKMLEGTLISQMEDKILSKEDFQKDSLSYVVHLFSTLCKAHQQRLLVVRNKVGGRSAYLFIEEVVEIQSHLK